MATVSLSEPERTELSRHIARFASREVAPDDLTLIVNQCVTDPKRATDFVEYLLSLHHEWTSARVLQKSWRLYKEELLNAVDDGGGFHYRSEGSSPSAWWLNCICFLALWKFPYAEHRSPFRAGGRLSPPPADDLFAEYSSHEKAVTALWVNGCKWLDKQAEKLNWRLPNPFPSPQEEKDLGSVQEQAMFIFTRSHLAWKEDCLVYPVKTDPIQVLLHAQNADGSWSNYLSLEELPGGRTCSLRATGMAICALGDWEQSLSSVLENEGPNAPGYMRNFAQDAHLILQEQQPLLAEVREACKRGLALLSKTRLPSSGWPDNISCVEADRRATSHALYALERFGQRFDLDGLDDICWPAEEWLATKINNSLRTETPSEEEIAEVALGITVLARDATPSSAIWLKSCMKWLLETSRNSEPSYPPNGTISCADVWRLYAVMEVIRRENCAKYIDRLL